MNKYYRQSACTEA